MHVVSSISSSFLFIAKQYSIVWIYHSLSFTTWGTLGCFQFGAIIKLLWICMYKFLCGHILSLPLVKYLGEDWLDLVLGICLSFKETAQPFSRVVAQFYVYTWEQPPVQFSDVLWLCSSLLSLFTPVHSSCMVLPRNPGLSPRFCESPGLFLGSPSPIQGLETLLGQ